MKTGQELGYHNGNKSSEMHNGCVGCENLENCGGKKADDMPLPNLQRIRTDMKKFVCHSFVTEFAPRPPDPKAARRDFGEAAVQY